ncbi:hypothetical protein EPUS_09515 [Endocarpon pusillum Z07020]|uniref:Uncharacterized protein n=1 Tax=Endocarpon pusillum (strain Z07020 / HMAS-L-300199) TaxID=1263415 RepID=U1GAE9_ENDPU|nr:uncharacterized protein EPUS_09515 [Endocarpon pusillum Z07020]ERF68636.1 hypothetical protein EPUS_09515 [Endocarpon pusillum Z07020]
MSKLRLSKSTADEMALLLAIDVKPQEIARRFRCHCSTVYRIQENINTFGEARPAPVAHLGPPRKITPEALEGLLDWLLENGSEKKLSYLDEMVAFLDEEYDIDVSKSTVSRALAKEKITQKAVSIYISTCSNRTHFVKLLNVKLLSEMRTYETIIELKYAKFVLRRLYSSTNRLRTSAQKTVKEVGLHAAYPVE